MKDHINILACSNGRFFQHLAVMLVSLAVNNPNERLNVVVVTGDATNDHRRKLDRTLQDFPNVQLSVRSFSPPTSLNLYTPGNYTLDNYTRLWVADFFDPDTDRVLYLDADTLIVGSISELWEHDLGGKLLGAVSIPNSSRWQKLDMPGEFGYFNSGVMLIDLSQWRQRQALNELLAVLNRSGEAFTDVDQDALNVCFYAARQPLAYKWNVITPFYLPSHDLKLSPFEISEVKREARIIHFNGSSRPWSYHSRHPRKADYYSYLAKTEWRDFKPADRKPVDILRKHVGPMLPSGFKKLLRPLLKA